MPIDLSKIFYNETISAIYHTLLYAILYLSFHVTYDVPLHARLYLDALEGFFYF